MKRLSCTIIFFICSFYGFSQDAQTTYDQAVTETLTGRTQLMEFILLQNQIQYDNAMNQLKSAINLLNSNSLQSAPLKSEADKLKLEIEKDVSAYNTGFKNDILKEKKLLRRNMVLYNGAEYFVSAKSEMAYESLLEKNAELKVHAKR